MISAFGVEHGEVSKALPGFGALGSKIAGGTMKAGQGMRKFGAGQMQAGRMGQQKFGPQRQKMGAGGVMAGGGLRKLGQGMQKRPGLTGGIAAGGAAAGAGAAGGSLMNRRRF